MMVSMSLCNNFLGWPQRYQNYLSVTCAAATREPGRELGAESTARGQAERVAELLS
jgi:hypothetical protein